MSSKLIIPTTSTGPRSYDDLFGLHDAAIAALDRGQAIELDFTKCTFLHQNAVAFIGGLIRYFQFNGGEVHTVFDKMDEKVRINLRKNGFMEAFGFEKWNGPSNSIPFREDSHRDISYLNYLRDLWLGRQWVDVSDKVKDAIASAVWEIYANAFEHGGASCGVFTCGQFFPGKREISLAFVDFGIGIPASVRTVPKVGHLDDARAIEWAMKAGNTSKAGNRGMGLDILRTFVVLNGGSMDIVSHRGHLAFGKLGPCSLVRKRSFLGTVFNITLLADNKRYILSSEINPESVF